jgi:hypothetical protein
MEDHTTTKYQPILGDPECDFCEEKDNGSKRGFFANRVPNQRTCLLLLVLIASLLTNIAFITQKSRFIYQQCDNKSAYGMMFDFKVATFVTNISSKHRWL